MSDRLIAFIERFDRLPMLGELAGALAHNKSMRAGGLLGSSPALLSARFAARTKRPMLIVTPDQRSAYHTLADLSLFLSDRSDFEPLIFPHTELLPYEDQLPQVSIRLERSLVIRRVCTYTSPDTDKDEDRRIPLIVSPIQALLRRNLPPTVYADHAYHLRRSDELDREAFAEWLVKQGYVFSELVSVRGQFSTRGGIIDVYPLSYPDPVRIELFGDEIDSIRTFDVASQRSVAQITSATLFPTAEEAMQKEALENDECNLVSYFESLLPGAPILLVEPDTVHNEVDKYTARIERRFEEVTAEDHEDHELVLDDEVRHQHIGPLLLPPAELYLSPDALDVQLAKLNPLELSAFRVQAEENSWNFETEPPEFFSDDQGKRIASLLQRGADGHELLILCDTDGQQTRLRNLIDESAQQKELPSKDGAPEILVGELGAGFSIPALNIHLITDREIFGRVRRFKTPAREEIVLPIIELVDLQPGQFVVHLDHGIARFVRLKTIEHEGKSSEYLELSFANDDVLYVPIEQIERVGRYVGSDEKPPALSKLGTKGWEKSKAKAKQAIEDMADELLDLYAKREVQPGHAFAADAPWQLEFEASFPYEETPDQWRAIEETKHDMEAASPMDRLICGDVGFGKTEVAIRSAFKSVCDGKQVAVLSPTTILADQHYHTFRERLSDYPVQIELFSRFRTAAQLKEGVQKLKEGEVDIAIGTHRLLSKDVKFNDLGLIIIDEEQRFGVKHKERLRQLRATVDTLALSATPIPRTLYLSLSGIRDISVITTPPKNRLPIETYIMEWSKDVIEEAILREMQREGQVYFVHNRVETIVGMAAMLQQIVPEARLGIGHGQMSEHELEQVMAKFIRGELDILVATTIIENGLDIPNVNTIIVNNADKFGLSQLYQLRGRVGRDRHRAYCYLLVQDKRSLTGVARERLLALQTHNQLGAGFQIAMRDMEIRGIGNILGRQQHGHIAAIGFDLYTRLLGDAVRKVKGRRELVRDWETMLEMIPKGAIPQSYITFNKQRMAYHQRISKIKQLEEIDQLAEELRDIYGPRPPEVDRLLLGVRLRVMGHDAGFDTVSAGAHRGQLIYHASQAGKADPLKLAALDGIDDLKVTLATKGDAIGLQFEDISGEGNIAEKLLKVFEHLKLSTEELQLLQAENRAQASEARKSSSGGPGTSEPRKMDKPNKKKKKLRLRLR